MTDMTNWESAEQEGRHANETATPFWERGDFLAKLRYFNMKRAYEWFGNDDPGVMFDAAELGGEAGELLNVCKKIAREKAGMPGSRTNMAEFKDEIADVLICLDKLAGRYGIDLAEATVSKFNRTSRKVGFDIFLPRVGSVNGVVQNEQD